MNAARSTWTKSLALIALTLTLACSGGSDATGPTPPPPPPPPPPTAQSGNVAVSIAGFAFKPASLTITAGSTVTWTNSDAVTHTATSDGGEFDSGDLTTNASFSHTFANKGTFTHHCAIHSNMQGTITVQ